MSNKPSSGIVSNFFASRGATLASRLATVVVGLGFALGALGATGCSDSRAPDMGQSHQELTQAQCSYFAANGRVQVCHHTSSTRKPYNVIKIDISGCNGHDGHDGDYIASVTPGTPAYDPTCNGQGCLPAGSPSDGSGSPPEQRNC